MEVEDLDCSSSFGSSESEDDVTDLPENIKQNRQIPPSMLGKRPPTRAATLQPSCMSTIGKKIRQDTKMVMHHNDKSSQSKLQRLSTLGLQQFGASRLGSNQSSKLSGSGLSNFSDEKF